VSGDDVKRNQTRGVRQELPAGAGTAGPAAPAEGSGEAVRAENEAAAREPVRWVGLQHVMYGFCGRAQEAGAGPAGVGEGGQSAAAPAGAGLQLRRNRAMAARVAPKPRTRGAEDAGDSGPESRAA